MIFLFDQSVISQPTGADYCLMSFLSDLIRSGNFFAVGFQSIKVVFFVDLSIPDVIIIPTCLYRTNLSFNQPFLFKVENVWIILEMF